MPELSEAKSDTETGFDLPGNLPRDLSVLLGYWKSLGGAAGRPPPKKRFDPLAVPRIWQSLMIVENVAGDGDVSRLRYRFSGNRHDTRRGLSLTGKFVDEVLGDEAWQRFRVLAEDIMKRGAPHHSSASHRDSEGRKLPYERLIVPLTGETGRTDFLVGVWQWKAPVSRDVSVSPDGGHSISSRHGGR
ncbi:MAG: PAS domain-containing protein [Minwuia sp.]|uniref:PAS domain-containing protein n=1 Tax=Minwuia sp. TaxID=2493630 RepID=UPI003A892F6E